MQFPSHTLKCFLSAAAILALPSCRDDEQLYRLQEEIRTLGEQQSQAQSELSRLKMQLNSLGKERDSLKQEKTKLDADVEALRKTLDQMQKDFAAYRQMYKLSMSKKAPGMPIGDFLVGGKPYQNVKARAATEELLTVIHDSGTQRFPWNALPDEVRMLFGHEKPGECPMIDFSHLPAKDLALSEEDRIARHDARAVELQRTISGLEVELDALGRLEKENRKNTAEATYRNLPKVDLDRARNACFIKRTLLESEIRKQKKLQDAHVRQDPRKMKRP